MVKVKLKGKKKKNISDRLHQRPVSTKELNPFEMHVNRQKYDVVGRKLKSEKGLPGISRSKAIRKRKATLLQEYKIKDKANKFLDRRIGERNSAMTAEDRVIARFAAERMKMFNKKQLFNLADEEVLTHRGQSLCEIEKFDDPRSDDDDDDNEGEQGRLGADFVEDAHFGGGLLRRPDEGEKKSHKDLIEQLIAESKKRKAEKQKQRELTIELTEKLDTEWHDLLPIVNCSRSLPSDAAVVEKPDAYDTLMRELKFEARGRATDPLKSVKEEEEEEARRTAELEVERQRRMLGTVASNAQARLRSADDLDDGFHAEEDEEGVGLSYDLEGNMQLDSLQNDERGMTAIEKGDNDSSGDSDDIDAQSEDEEGDSLSDLKPSSESEGEVSANASVEATPPLKESLVRCAQPPKQKEMPEKERRSFLQKMLKTHPKLLSVSSVPDESASLHEMFNKCTAKEQADLLAHIIELNEGNRNQLERLFAQMVQHVCVTASKPLACMAHPHGFAVLDSVIPSLYDLAHKFPEASADAVAAMLKEKQEEFQLHQHTYPSMATLILFKLISLLFPTSDFRHPVVTPSVVFMCQMLFQCRIKTRRDVACGLFLVSLILEFTVLSKRFSPAAVNFLCGVLHLALGAEEKEERQTVPPFKNEGPLSELLVLEVSRRNWRGSCQMTLVDLQYGEPLDDSFRIRALYTALGMLCEFQQTLSILPAGVHIFQKAAVFLSRLPVDRYPECISSKVKGFLETNLEVKKKPLQYLVAEKKRPRALRLYEPRVEEKIFDVKKRRPMGRAKAEQEKLLHKVKREQKAALREIRRDNAFISKLKWKETIQSDKERVEKVKEIFGAAANQQGELRRIEREKNKGKRK